MTKTRLWNMRWPEVAELDVDETLIVLPTGAIEQHGRHLPLDTDISGPWEIAESAAGRWLADDRPGRLVVAPPIWWGTSPHHLAYNGTISLQMQTMSDLIFDICRSLNSHGLYRILILNGHGGNAGVIDATTLRISDELGLSVASTSYWKLIADILEDVGESEIGGMGHGGEMETSMQLSMRPELVATAEIEQDLPKSWTSFTGIDFREPGPVGFPWDFSKDSMSGTMGDPTRGDAAKGEKILDAAVGRVLHLCGELLSIPRERIRSDGGPVR